MSVVEGSTVVPNPDVVDIDALSASVTKQASLVRQLKKDGCSSQEIASAVEELQRLKISVEELRKHLAAVDASFNRRVFDELLLRRMFVVPSFEIHGGVKGLFDLGPPGCAVKAAMIDTWRKHFVLFESMLEMECTNLTPECVLKTSGHVDRFTDLMVKDVETGECFRGDKLLEDIIDQLLDSPEGKLLSTEEREEHLRVQRQADAYTAEQLDELLVKYRATAPSGQPYSKSFPFNLMFKTSIGPEGTAIGYLRPETAQGLFVNFKRLLDYNAQKMPFAAAQIGMGFRNEIAPRSGLLRVREFCMAEIEHFVDPQDKSHPNFASVSQKELVLFSREAQLGSGKTCTKTVGDAVAEGIVNNQTLGYFMARTQLYMEKIGLNPTKLRFRQHLTTEMAHYACDCWDLEIHTSYGWVECVGHADRACYDLEVHSKATKTPMLAVQKLDQPKDVTIAKLKLDRKVLGHVFKQDQRAVANALEALAENWENFETHVVRPLEATGEAMVDDVFRVTQDMLTWTKAVKKIHEVKFTPSVIEPSFGMGRILYALLEHSFYQRDGDEQRIVMRFNPRVAPNKVAVLPISSGVELNEIVSFAPPQLFFSPLNPYS
jgi:glycyl-tRNA synthetase